MAAAAHTMKLRSHRTPEPGAFLVMDRAKAAAAGGEQPLLDLSVGSSDLPPPPEALAAIQASLSDATASRYCLRSATLPLLNAAVEWFQGLYPDAPALDPATQALSLVGSQEGLAHLLLAVTDPGDSILMLDCAYPSYFGAVKIAGLVPCFMPYASGAPWLPDLAAVPAETLQRCTCMLLNYPHNPTGAVVDAGFWQATLEVCRRHGLLLIHDAPYLTQVYAEPGIAPSPLAQPGAADCCVELHSFAKSYQMGGMRLGFALGNAQALAALEAVKAPIDFNQWLGIQRAGIACLRLPDGRKRLREYAAVWQARAAALAGVLRQHGWEFDEPTACMYLWVRLPSDLGLDDLEFCTRLVAETGVALSPGRGFGPGGVGWVRFALVAPEALLVDAGKAVAAFADMLRSADRLRAAAARAFANAAEAAA